MKFTADVQLVPLKAGANAYEPILVSIEDYPAGLVHIDNFYNSRELYDHLRRGQGFVGKITIGELFDPNEGEPFRSLLSNVWEQWNTRREISDDLFDEIGTALGL
jgi:hypothetical protein